MKFTQLDIQQASAKSSPSGEIYLRLSQGYWERSGSIVRLANALFGLRQNLGVFKRFLVYKLKECSFDKFWGDPCTFR